MASETKTKTMASRRKAKEADSLPTEVPPGVQVVSADPNSDSWVFRIDGSGAVEGQTFAVTIYFPDNYPFAEPTVEVVTDMPEAGFDCQGIARGFTRNRVWSPALTVVNVLNWLCRMLQQPRSEDQGWRLTRNHSWRSTPLQPPLAPSVRTVRHRISTVQSVPGLVHIHGALSEDECVALIRMAELCGFDDAHHDAYQNKRIDMSEETYRRNDRVVYQAAPDESSKLFERIAGSIPTKIDAKAEYISDVSVLPQIPDGRFGVWHQDGLNDMWRFYRYDPHKKQEFPKHQDNATVKRRGLVSSWLSVLFYLSGEDFQGGNTAFFDGNNRVVHEVVPKQGDAVAFFHQGFRSPLHAGMPVLDGEACKYVLRTDAMYRSAVRVKDGPTLRLSPPYDEDSSSDSGPAETSEAQ